MIIGNGDIASVIPDRLGFTFFASGVSNSQETNEDAYQREIDLLIEQDLDTRLVYFSSLAVFDSEGRYFEHKRNMEYIVKQFPFYNIVRLGNISWGSNPHTLINYLRAHPKAEIHDDWRYVCDKEEFQHWLNKIPAWNCELSIIGRRMKVKDIYKEYVHGN
jgi:hypothetical protein